MTKPKQKNYQIYVVAVNDDDHKTYPPYTYLSLVACIQWLFWSSATLRYAEDWEQIIMKSFSFLLNAVIPIGWMTITCWSELMKPCMQTSLSLLSVCISVYLLHPSHLFLYPPLSPFWIFLKPFHSFSSLYLSSLSVSFLSQCMPFLVMSLPSELVSSVTPLLSLCLSLPHYLSVCQDFSPSAYLCFMLLHSMDCWPNWNAECLICTTSIGLHLL